MGVALGEAEPELQRDWLQRAVRSGRVLEIALEVRLQTPAHRRPPLRRRRQRMLGRSLPPAPASSSSRARARLAGVSRALPVSSRSPSSVSFSAACASASPRERLGVGIEPVRAQHPLDEPAQRTCRSIAPATTATRRARAAARAAARPQRGGSPAPLAAPRPRRAARRPRPAACARGDSERLSANRSHTSSTNSDLRHRLAFVVRHVPAQEQPLLRARDGRVQQVALGREHVLLLAEPQPADLRQPPALLLGQERLRPRARREHALLQAAHEQRPHPARAQRQRVEHRHGAARQLAPAAGVGPAPPGPSAAPADARRSARAAPACPPARRAVAGASPGAIRASSRSSPSARRPAASALASSRSSASSTWAVPIGKPCSTGTLLWHRFHPIVPAAEILFKPDIHADEKISAAHLLDLELGFPVLAVSPGDGDDGPGDSPARWP